jgi:hypothetical protein
MNEIIITTQSELRQYIREAINDIIPLLEEHLKKVSERKPKENLTPVEALEYLSELGFRTTRSSLNNFIFRKKIPYRKIGKRVVFTRQELLQWVENITSKNNI